MRALLVDPDEAFAMEMAKECTAHGIEFVHAASPEQMRAHMRIKPYDTEGPGPCVRPSPSAGSGFAPSPSAGSGGAHSPSVCSGLSDGPLDYEDPDVEAGTLPFDSCGNCSGAQSCRS